MAFHDLIFAFLSSFSCSSSPYCSFLSSNHCTPVSFFFWGGGRTYLSTSSLFFTRVTPTNTSGLYTTILQKDFLWHLGQVPLLRSDGYALCLTYCYTLFQLLCLVSIYFLLNHKLHEGMKNICCVHKYLSNEWSTIASCIYTWIQAMLSVCMPFISSSVLLILIQILRQSSVISTSKPPALCPAHTLLYDITYHIIMKHACMSFCH